MFFLQANRKIGVRKRFDVFNLWICFRTKSNPSAGTMIHEQTIKEKKTNYTVRPTRLSHAGIRVLIVVSQCPLSKITRSTHVNVVVVVRP